MIPIEYSWHGIERARERGNILTVENAKLQIQRAWRLGRPADLDLCASQWMNHVYLYFDGLVFVFRVDDPNLPPVHLTVLFPKGETEWRVRAA